METRSRRSVAVEGVADAVDAARRAALVAGTAVAKVFPAVDAGPVMVGPVERDAVAAHEFGIENIEIAESAPCRDAPPAM